MSTVATMLRRPWKHGHVALGVVRRRVLEVGQPAQNRADGREGRQAERPRRGRLEPIDAEDEPEDVEQDDDGGAADDDVDEQRVKRVSQPRAVEQVLEQTARTANAPKIASIAPAMALPTPRSRARRSLEHHLTSSAYRYGRRSSKPDAE